MTYYLIAVAVVAAFCAFFVWLVNAQGRRRERAFERAELGWQSERKELLDRIMYLSGKVWNPPPESPLPPVIEEDAEIIVWPEQALPYETEIDEHETVLPTERV